MNTEIILEIVLIVIGLYLALYKSYFQEKGKNIATKEDVVEITRKVEEVKSQINAISLKEQDNFLEFKKSLLEYNNELVKWVEFSIKDISLVDNDPLDKEGLKRKLVNLHIQFSNVQMAYWKLFIYSNKDDEKWFEKIWKELNDILPLHQLTTSFLDEIIGISNKLSFQRDSANLSKTTIEELVSKKRSFVTKREKLQQNAINALHSTANLLREQLQIKYKFDDN